MGLYPLELVAGFEVKVKLADLSNQREGTHVMAAFNLPSLWS